MEVTGREVIVIRWKYREKLGEIVLGSWEDKFDWARLESILGSVSFFIYFHCLIWVHGIADVAQNDKSRRGMGNRVVTDKLSVQAVYLARG